MLLGAAFPGAGGKETTMSAFSSFVQKMDTHGIEQK